MWQQDLTALSNPAGAEPTTPSGQKVARCNPWQFLTLTTDDVLNCTTRGQPPLRCRTLKGASHPILEGPVKPCVAAVPQQGWCDCRGSQCAAWIWLHHENHLAGTQGCEETLHCSAVRRRPAWIPQRPGCAGCARCCHRAELGRAGSHGLRGCASRLRSHSPCAPSSLACGLALQTTKDMRASTH